jgi:hypothetical protein
MKNILSWVYIALLAAPGKSYTHGTDHKTGEQSTDGTCGDKNAGMTCWGIEGASCCSEWGWW